AYLGCITRIGAALPDWAVVSAPKLISLTLTPGPASGPVPLNVQFSVVAQLSVPIAHWLVTFGDGAQIEGTGAPPPTLPHTYAQDATYHAVLIVYASAPFTPDVARFLTSADVTAGTGASRPVSFVPTPTAGTAPLAVSFQTDLNLPAGVDGWPVRLGAGNH